ncbi:helix-turn-helix domain-containing protein [Tenacibaculum sp. TC6]|uniref:helix-turn-helix domain-containing protein n=1 Tax=Tenacibaculum sp. TC6 TaxID=3423223 RepID=UPI003D36D967
MEIQGYIYFASTLILSSVLLNNHKIAVNRKISKLCIAGKVLKKEQIHNTKYQSYFEKHSHIVNDLVSEEQQKYVKKTLPETLTILSYFATSLFTKNSIETVFWDIVKNCISQLGLEDCVLYYVENNKLIQKAAYGNKGNEAAQKILSPITIAMGEGIVGTVAQTGKYELIKDTNKDSRYIVDDKIRRSELAVPIKVNKKVIGVLDSENAQPNFFKKNHLFLFQLVADLLEKKLQQIYQKGINIKDDNIYFQELKQLLEHSKVYRNNTLSLDAVAEQLNISSNYLSQIINKIQGCNFSDYINTHRVNDVKKKMNDKHFSNYTIVSMALEAGFNSKSAFYNAFKKHTGMSPKQYKEKNKPYCEE